MIMSIGVNNNQAALIALQNLNRTEEDLRGVQNRVSTGRKINDAKDNASVWSIAQKQRSDVGALSSVKMSLDRASSIGNVSMIAGTSISDLLVQMKEKVTSAMDLSLDTFSRTALNNDFKALLSQIKSTAQNATFDGANILDGSITAGIKFLSNADATSTITLAVQNMSIGGTNITFSAGSTILTASLASAVMVKLSESLAKVNTSMGAMGAQVRQIEAHNVFVSKLSDALETGVSNLVDADMAKESARLQALNVKQQLGAQSLSIANQSPQIVLKLFQ
jgi:flagellin